MKAEYRIYRKIMRNKLMYRRVDMNGIVEENDWRKKSLGGGQGHTGLLVAIFANVAISDGTGCIIG